MTFILGQHAQISTNITRGVATALPRVLDKYDPNIVLEALRGREDIFTYRLERAIEQAIDSMLIIAPRGTVSITLTEPHDPDVFFRTCPGLHVMGDFRSRIVANVRLVSAAGMVVRLKRFDIMQGTTDGVVEGLLSKSHPFSLSDLCAAMAELITRQSNGKKDVLGADNIFYTSRSRVSLRWRHGLREWRVSACSRQRSDGKKSVGTRVFFSDV